MFFRLLRMDETGLLPRWQQGTSVDGNYCIQKIQREMNEHFKSGDKKRLTLKDLSGAFAVFGVGNAIGIAALTIEIYCGRILKNRKAAAVGIKNPKSNANKPPTESKLKSQITAGKVIQLEAPELDEPKATA